MAHIGGNDWMDDWPDNWYDEDVFIRPVKPSEECTQETLPFEDEEKVKGVAYPLLLLPSGLFVYKDDIPPAEPKPPESKSGPVLFIPNKNKKSAQAIKMHPLTGVAIRSKTADKHA